jgi:broad specificity phosphatase PhoE
MRAMEAPGIARHSRPFFAPLWFMPLAALAVLLVAFALYEGANTTMVILVQPTEKDPGTIDDPPASPEGEERAERLAHMFGSTGGVGRVDAIYVSDDRRAHQAAAPLAERLQRVPSVFSGADARAAAGRVRHEHSGGVVLVVASGTALPLLLKDLAGVEPASAADQPDVIYIISIPTYGHAHVARLVY